MIKLIKKFANSKLADSILKSFCRGDINRNDRQGMLYKAWSQVIWNQIEGDYIEFGVYKGKRLSQSKAIYRLLAKQIEESIRQQEKLLRSDYKDYERLFFGLDTFDGMPKNSEGNESFQTGAFMCSVEDVKYQFQLRKISMSNVFLFSGLFSETAEQVKKHVKKASIVNIDGDLYSSAVDALDAIEHAIGVGTILLFDDYNSFHSDNRKGERRAFSEFSERTDLVFEKWMTYEISGQGFLCVDKKQGS